MSTAIVWFRRDLRLSDNPALLAALASSTKVIPLYIHQNRPLGADHDWSMGSASRWWLHHSLEALDTQLRQRGSRLLILEGEPLAILRQLLATAGVDRVFWNRLYDPADIARDTGIKQVLRHEGCQVETYNSALLYEPWEVRRENGEPYRVFTPFWKAMQKRGIDRPPEPAPLALPPVTEQLPGLLPEALGLLPQIPWDAGLRSFWQVGEVAAQTRLMAFITDCVGDYQAERDRPDHAGTSRLSPHLHFGEISPRQIVSALRDTLGPDLGAGVTSYIRELAWREFAHHLLFHFPHTADEALDQRFLAFPWQDRDESELRTWQRGLTGFPIIDAGMRELWSTGWMHNRVRMIVGSLLTKNLLIPWQTGARWFWDTLVDADLASNTLGWQWVAGCGADAAPYFRIFNPVLQGERFDPSGDYVRRWVPELGQVPAGLIHKPWLSGKGLKSDYPPPMVDLAASRIKALSAYAEMKSRSVIPGLSL
jgi:deoxyribodipyrimidine photo-lyase